jgi:hypothetical protein
MGIVEAKILTVEDIYRLVLTAVANKPWPQRRGESGTAPARVEEK